MSLFVEALSLSILKMTDLLGFSSETVTAVNICKVHRKWPVIK